MSLRVPIRRGHVFRLPRSISGSTRAPSWCRLLSTSPSLPRLRPRRLICTTLFLTSTLSLGVFTIGLYTDAKTCPSPPFKLANSGSETGSSSSLLTLFRTYFVYGLISVPVLVDHAQDMLDVLLKVPLLGGIAEAIVRHTFFQHFVGGDTVHDVYPLIAELRDKNKGVMMVYSVEVDENEAAGAERHGQTNGKASGQPVHKRIVDEIIKSIEVAANFEDGLNSGAGGVTGRPTCVAVKLTALLPNVQALYSFSLHLTRTRPALSPPVPFPGTPASSDLAVLNTRTLEGSPLTAEDVRDLNDLYDDLNKICTRAKERRVKVVLDAEYSWYQPAIDAFGHALMEKYNKLPEELSWVTRWMLRANPAEGMPIQPLVYVTYQAYLRRTAGHLARSLTLAREKGYALGVKLVRGAYHPYELAAHTSRSLSSADTHTHGPISISPDPYPPVHPSKPETDACYNECAVMLVRAVADDLTSPASPPRPPHIGVLFGTHNWLSCELVLEELVKNGLAREDSGGRKGTLVVPPEVAERITFSQLYGMSDSLSNYLAGRTKSSAPCVIKYMPYGALREVMPYLSRRAIENKSVLGDGGAIRERKEAAREIWRRVFGGVGLLI
ncbi:FAD-linked oxidoreductase [Paxillus ammoniavirescens]|nr:FAD-linked oxidoreductase [Paxillus ammoniavirescens]